MLRARHRREPNFRRPDQIGVVRDPCEGLARGATGYIWTGRRVSESRGPFSPWGDTRGDKTAKIAPRERGRSHREDAAVVGGRLHSLGLGFQSAVMRLASAICAGVNSSVSSSLAAAASVSPLATARLYHM